MDPYQNDQLEQAANQVKRRTSSLCSTPPPSNATCIPQSYSPVSPAYQTETRAPPDIVLLGLWPYATDEQIEFYLDGYNIIYPSAHVIPIRHGQRHRKAALDILIDACEKRSLQEQPQTLLHLFGNDGSAGIVEMLRSFRVRTSQTLPIQAVIMDSTPAMPVPSLADTIDSPQRLFVFTYTVLWAIYSTLISLLTFGYSDTASEHVRSGLHDPSLVPGDARKVYIWAARDIMFSWRRANTVVSKGTVRPESDECDIYEYAVKRSTVDEKGRWTGNQERYWLGIESVWSEESSL